VAADGSWAYTDSSTMASRTFPSLRRILREAVHHEYKARATLRAAAERFGRSCLLVRLSMAGNRRVCMLEGLLLCNGFTLARDPWDRTRVGLPRFPDEAEACAAAAMLRRRSVELYDGWLELDLPPTVRDGLRRLRDAARVEELPELAAGSLPTWRQRPGSSPPSMWATRSSPPAGVARRIPTPG
jgi:hypothetical protein